MLLSFSNLNQSVPIFESPGLLSIVAWSRDEHPGCRGLGAGGLDHRAQVGASDCLVGQCLPLHPIGPPDGTRRCSLPRTAHCRGTVPLTHAHAHPEKERLKTLIRRTKKNPTKAEWPGLTQCLLKFDVPSHGTMYETKARHSLGQDYMATNNTMKRLDPCGETRKHVLG